MYYTTEYFSPIGKIILASDEVNIVGLWIEKQKYFSSTIADKLVEKDDLPVLRLGKSWLNDYFAGKKPKISSLPLAPVGNEFRQNVWRILTEIPYGQLSTYGEIAKEVAVRMGKPRMASQAVGGAVGHNPISIIIPCHRVIGTKGNLTGYAGGIDLKIKLLEHEGVSMANLFVPKNIK